jgi:hypothetical protein
MICCHLSGLVTQRHDHLAMTWRRTMARARLHSAAKPHLGLARREREAQRGVESRADFTTPMSSGVVIADVSIVHPTAPSFVATTTGAAARSGDAFKRAHYARRRLGGGYELVPVSVESFGRLGVPAYALLGHVADMAADCGGVSKAAFMESALQETGVMLAKGNGRLLRAHLSRVAQASGRAYLPGLPVPVSEVVGLKDPTLGRRVVVYGVFCARIPDCIAGACGCGGVCGSFGRLVGHLLVVYSVCCAVWLVLSFSLGTYVRAFLALHVAMVSAFMALSSCAGWFHDPVVF